MRRVKDSGFESLVKQPADALSPVLSLYVNAGPASSWSAKRPFETLVKNEGRALQAAAGANAAELDRDLGWAADYLAGYKKASPCLALFCDRSRNFLWSRELPVALPNAAKWQSRPYVLPLLETMDEEERCAVLLVDRSRARLFSVFMNEIEEEDDFLAAARVQHIKTASKDNLRSHDKLDQASEAHVRRHLLRAVRETERLAQRRPFRQLIIGGAREPAAEAAALLRPSLAPCLIGRIHIDVRSSEDLVLRKCLQLRRENERAVEEKLVDKLIDSAAKSKVPLLGAAAVARHIAKQQADILVYAEGFQAAGTRCPSCGHLYADVREACGRCEIPTEAADDLLNDMALAVLSGGGRVEQVKGRAAERLLEAGGIGVILKQAR